jgi:translocation and assembly module TamB
LSRLLVRTLRALAGTFAVLVILLTLLAGGFWWWSGTDGSLAWLLDRVGRSQPLVAEGVSGSMRSGLQVKRLVWERDGLKVEADEVRIEWSPLSLISRELKLDQLHAVALKVTDTRAPSTEKLKPPESIELPLQLDIDNVKIDRIEYRGANSVQASDLAAGYVFDGKQHQLWLRSLKYADGRYQGKVTIGASGPLPVEANVQGTVTTPVPAGKGNVPLSFKANVKGPLRRLQADAVVSVTSPPAAGQPAPGATVQAVLTPFEAQPLPQAQARLTALDLHSFWAQAPQTQLSGEIKVEPAGTQSWTLSADLRNAQPGPWNAQRLPLEHVKAQGQWRDGRALVRSLQAELAGGSLQAQGEWAQGGWKAEGTLKDIDPARVYSQFAASPVAGKVQLRQQGKAIAFDVALESDGKLRPASKSAARGPDAPPALLFRELNVQGNWNEGVLEVPQVKLRTSDSTLQGSVTAQPAAPAGSGKLTLQAPGLQARIDGAVAAASGGGTAKIDVTDVARAQRWAQSLPYVPKAIAQLRATGSATLDLNWKGGWQDPTVQAALVVPRLTLQPAAAQAQANVTPKDGIAPTAKVTAGEPAALPWTVRDTRASVTGRLADASLALQVRAEQGLRNVTIDVTGRGGKSADAWRARIGQLKLALQDPALGGDGPWRAELREGFEARWLTGPRKLEVGAGQAVLTPPKLPSDTAAPQQTVLAWEPVTWGGGELQTAGRISGLPMAWLELFGGPQLAGSALSSNMVFDAQWKAALGQSLRLDASLVRSAGDISVLAENAEGKSTRVMAGVRTARLTLKGRDDQVTLGLEWDSEMAGKASGRLQTRLTRGGPAGWAWPAAAPLEGAVQAQLPKLAAWSLLAPPGWRLRGSLNTDIKISGTRSNPQFGGTVSADDLALRSVVDGIELRDGRLRARLQGQQLLVDEFVLQGAGKDGTGGRVVVSGEGRWTAAGPQLQASARLEKLKASIRSDRELTVSGQLTATVTDKATTIRGDVKVDRARILIPEEVAPKLSDDVIVRNEPRLGRTADQRASNKPAGEAAKAPTRKLDLQVKIDLGDDFRLAGRGISTRLAGDLNLTGQSFTEPRLVGTLRTVRGEFNAYGQRLDIERGVVRFTGPISNPSLDILAVRPRLEQRVGVMVSGSAQAPFVRLYSEPDLPDAEKLSWLVVGKPTASGGAEAALLQQAAVALLASRKSGASSGGIAGRFGLDELSVGKDDAAGGAVVTLGKRFARDFYASYETSLGGALGTLNIFYDISKRLTLRARTGTVSAVDLIYTLSFD